MENITPLYTVSLPDFGLSPISSTVSATKSSSEVNIHIWAEEFIDPPKNIGSFPNSFTWKEFAKILMNLDEGFIGEDAIDKVVVTGIAGLRAECLKYAWATENNGSYPFDSMIAGFWENVVQYCSPFTLLLIKTDNSTLLTALHGIPGSLQPYDS